MNRVIQQLRTIGKLPVNVLSQGENGTGKALVARPKTATAHAPRRSWGLPGRGCIRR